MKLFKFIVSLSCVILLTSCSSSSVNSKAEGFKIDYSNKTVSNSKELPTVVFYYANWCPYCKKASPVVDKLTKEYAGKVLFFPVDLDSEEGKKFAATFKNGQDGIPHFQFFGKKGNMMEDKIGFLPEEVLRQRIQANFKI